MKHTTITFITGNKNKRDQVARYLSKPIISKDIDLPEIQSLSLKDVVAYKAKAAYEILRAPVLVEDTSLTLSELNGLPGPFIKWFEKELGNEGLVQLVKSFQNKNASTQIMFGLYDGRTLHTFDSILHGTISETVRSGPSSFGWNSIFMPVGSNKTLSELTDEELEIVNPRKHAVEKLEKFLKEDSGQ